MKRKKAGHGVKTNHCFACGPDNPGGMHLKFIPDSRGRGYLCDFRLTRRYTGPPKHCHGGIIATILDDAMSKLNKTRGVVAVTSRMTIDYLKPVPLRAALRVTSRELYRRGRRLIRTAEIVNPEGAVLARSRGVFIIVDPERLFRRE
jgi:uncharacterized protein (TIGR00369 family)